MSEFLLSAFADEYASDFTKQLEALKKLNIKNIEIRGIDGKNISELSLAEVKEADEKLKFYGISVSAIGSPLGKINIEGDINSHLETAKRIFEAANIFGSKNIRVFSFYLPEGKTRADCKEQVFDALSKLINISERFGVTLCHENEALIYGESPENCNQILQYFGGKLKAVFDMGNFVLDGYDPFAAYKKLCNHIEYFHIKDALSAGAVVPPGVGEAKIKDILDDYKSKSVRDTYITLEPHLQTFSGLNALAAKTFDNPYKYENLEVAFLDAYKRLRELL